MSVEILVNVTPEESRVGLLENGMLQEIWIERAGHRGIVGNIYMGEVVRVMPGMEAAFIDIGLERAAFLHVADMYQRHVDEEDADDSENNHEARKKIEELLKEGQKIPVQVVKDPLGTKGARLTTQLSVAARFLVAIPYSEHIGISIKIDQEEDRQRLKDAVKNIISENDFKSGYIVRTIGLQATEQQLLKDALYLQRLWRAVSERLTNAEKGQVLYEELPLHVRTLRDIMDEHIDKVSIDSKQSFDEMQEFAKKYMPDQISLLNHYIAERPIFDLHSVEDEIQKAMQRKVMLKSGGYLIVDQTEAMTTIDVNTGGFIGSRNLEETIYKTNLEAAQSIARQLRLRNLGGIIIIDFIDMEVEEHKRQVMRALEKSLEKDHARTQISDVSELGLVQMTRKRTRESLEHVLCESCAVCNGRGFVKTAETICYEIFREITRVSRLYQPTSLMILASQEVVDLLLDELSAAIAELEATIKRPINLQVDTIYSQEQYDVVIE